MVEDLVIKIFGNLKNFDIRGGQAETKYSKIFFFGSQDPHQGAASRGTIIINVPVKESQWGY